MIQTMAWGSSLTLFAVLVGCETSGSDQTQTNASPGVINAPLASLDELGAQALAHYESTEAVIFLEVATQDPNQAVDGTRSKLEVRRDDRLARVPFDVSSLPVGPLSKQIGGTVAMRTVLTGDDSGIVREHKALYRETNTDVRSFWTASELEARRSQLSPVSGDTGNEEGIAGNWNSHDWNQANEPFTVSVIFAPRIEADVAERVDWLGDLGEARSRKDVLMRAETELRQPEVQASISGGLEWIEGLGLACTVSARMVATNGVILENCSRSDLERLGEAGVGVLAEVSFERTKGADLHALPGDAGRSLFGLQTRVALNTDEPVRFAGEGPTSLSSDNVVVALIDEEGFFGADRHPAFYDWANPSMTCGNITAGFTTRVSGFSCTSTTCSTGGSWGSAPFNHGMTTLAAFGSILEGQDPCFPTTAGREPRSHAAFEASLRVFRNTPGIAPESKAIDFAATNGAHIISLSQGSDYTLCDNARTFSATLNAATDLALSLDSILVRSAGNSLRACDDNCFIIPHAALRTEIIAVGAMFDSISAGSYMDWPLMDERWSNLTLTPNCPATCPSSATCWSSSLGGANLRVGGTVLDNVRGIVDIVGPADLASAASYASDTSYGYATTGAGTSIAAPAVAAALVSLVDWGIVQGFPSVATPGIANVMVHAMGDGEIGILSHSHLPLGYRPTYSGMNRLWGAGRLRFRLPTDRGMDGPWGWGWGSISMNPGTVHHISAGGVPFSSAVDSYVAAVSWDERNINSSSAANAADIVLQLISTASSGPTCPSVPSGTVSTHVQDMTFDVQKLVRIRNSATTALHGRCVYARISYLSGPAARMVFYTDMWEDLARECSENLGQCGNPLCTSDPGCVE